MDSNPRAERRTTKDCTMTKNSPATPDRLISGPEVDSILSIGRQYRWKLGARRILPEPHYSHAKARPRWWLSEILAFASQRHPDGGTAAAERARAMEVAKRRALVKRVHAAGKVAA
jgi:predicted DNA-binding transcriptional regulator AlpA